MDCLTQVLLLMSDKRSPAFVGQHPDAMPCISVRRLSFLTRKVWIQILSRGALSRGVHVPTLQDFSVFVFFFFVFFFRSFCHTGGHYKTVSGLGTFSVLNNPFSVVRVSYLLFPSPLYLCLSVFPPHPTFLRLCQNIKQGMECEDMRSCVILGIY